MSVKEPRVRRRFYSERELAEILGLAVRTVQAWRFQRKGPPWKRLEGAVRYPIEDFNAWLALQPGSGWTAGDEAAVRRALDVTPKDESGPKA